MTPREVIAAYWRHCDARQWDAFEALLAPDVVYEVPQTRERVVGAAGYRDFFSTYPGPWRCSVQSVVADGRQAVSVVDFETAGQHATNLAVFTLDDAGRITHVADYWPEAYEPPARNSPHVVRY